MNEVIENHNKHKIQFKIESTFSQHRINIENHFSMLTQCLGFLGHIEEDLVAGGRGLPQLTWCLVGEACLT